LADLGLGPVWVWLGVAGAFSSVFSFLFPLIYRKTKGRKEKWVEEK
jgi:hypothetical protein